MSKPHADQALLSNFVITPWPFSAARSFHWIRLPGWAQHVLELLPLPHAAQAMQAARYRTTRAFSFLRPAFSWCRRRVYVGYPQCQERTGMNLSGGRCFCLMLGLSLLAHGGLFLNRSPLARLSESKEAPLSLRLAVTPAPPAPTNAAESSPQPPRLLRKKKRLPDQRPSRNLRRLKSVPPTRPKLKNGEQPPKKQQHRQSIPAHHRLNRQRPPHLPLHNTPYSRHKEKRKQPPLGIRHSTPWMGRNSSSRQHRVTHGWRNAKVSRDRCSWN